MSNRNEQPARETDRSPKPLAEAKVAIVFEWFQRSGGVERVIEGMLEVFPSADCYALVNDPGSLSGTALEGVPVRTSFIQSLPWAASRYRSYLPLMPFAIEQFDLRSYDLVLSSSHTVAKGVLTSSQQLHVSYTHTPVRYAWDLYQDYLIEGGLNRGLKGWVARVVLHYLRLWDIAASNRVDEYLANSHYVAKRIRKLYRRSAQVVYPPVNTTRYHHELPREDFYLTVSRFVPYKRLDLIVETFTKMGKPLVVVGDGPDRERVERLAGPNVELLGYLPDHVVAGYLERARAFVFAANEDFGIAPVEAQAAGCPVIAYGEGGALETVVGWPAPAATGMFFNTQSLQALEEAVRLFETHNEQFEAEQCRKNAERFGLERFCRELQEAVWKAWLKFHLDDKQKRYQ